MTDQERFWSNVIGGSVEHCWLWNSSKTGNGYGRFVVTTNGIRKFGRAHRWAYEDLRGDIPAGLVLDHLCRRKMCVNPWHLEPVSPKENVDRGIVGALHLRPSCRFGHPFTEENTQNYGSSRKCRTCAVTYCRLLRHTPAEVLVHRRAAGLQLVDLANYFISQAA
jgi:hypothetical protein